MDNPYGVIPVDKIDLESIREFGDHIEEYLELFEDCMVLPPGLPSMEKKSIKWARAKVAELVKKLHKGKLSVFEDPEEFLATRKKPF